MEYFIAKCKENSLKITPQRVAVYNEIFNDKTHPCAEKIYKKIVKKYPNMSFDTVNRTLISFLEIGIIGSVEGSGKSKKYDSCTKNHHHLHCIKCGDIIDFENKIFDNIKIPSSLSKKYKIINKRVSLEGICSKCLKVK